MYLTRKELTQMIVLRGCDNALLIDIIYIGFFQWIGT